MTEQRNTLRNTAVVLASLTIVAPVLTGRVVEAILDTTNPAGLDDVTAGLAYLREILVWSFSIAGVVVAGFLVVTILAWVRARSFRTAALPVAVFAVQIVAAVVILAANSAIDQAGS